MGGKLIDIAPNKLKTNTVLQVKDAGMTFILSDDNSRRIQLYYIS